jgi:hypothetical protein
MAEAGAIALTMAIKVENFIVNQKGVRYLEKAKECDVGPADGGNYQRQSRSTSITFTIFWFYASHNTVLISFVSSSRF